MTTMACPPRPKLDISHQSSFAIPVPQAHTDDRQTTV
ncbi:hypothetical protein CORC01_07549 [Colletotrichum orchidophilum]|uniref:Uncharacterized protein n=1 Tax=Colletotrichum orchidophilum TaxID=1209926 RepID=A0A1G4B6N8_9PEZI|nr:uncharacterized protein CORC01_07549 [Colletotrichum orchidophilum]OHE97108.1 hypothetical protein CORC01_07549 [Colletotrichum orchidophilum]